MKDLHVDVKQKSGCTLEGTFNGVGSSEGHGTSFEDIFE